MLKLAATIATISSITLTMTNSLKAQSDVNVLNQNDPMSQLTNVSELRDVAPTEWAYEALRSLVERYGCIVGYPDRTYRGNRALSRWEFAAGLNACLNTIERLLQENVTILKEDIETLKRLAKEFQSELTALAVRVDNLEGRTAFLEDHQFSTTTKLNIQMIWSVSDTFGDRVGSDRDETQTRLAYRIRLNLETSFDGKDLFRTRLQVSNFGNVVATTGTNMTQLNYDDNSNNRIEIPHLRYYKPLSDNFSIVIGPTGIGYTDITDTLTPPTIADDALGIPSRFGEYNPLYRRGGGGGAFNWSINKDLILTVGYLAGNPENANEGNGLFNGSYNALAQLAYYWDSGALGIAYSRQYANSGNVDLTGRTGSFLATSPFGNSIATSADTVAIQGFYRVTPNFQIHAWGNYTHAHANGSGFSDLSDGTGGTVNQFVGDGDSADIWYGAIGFTFPDVGGEGNLPGILLGIPPVVTSSDLRSDPDNAYHIEAFYRFRLNDNIAITPGFWVILNPENDSRNDTQWIGHIRTNFNF